MVLWNYSLVLWNFERPYVIFVILITDPYWATDLADAFCLASVAVQVLDAEMCVEATVEITSRLPLPVSCSVIALSVEPVSASKKDSRSNKKIKDNKADADLQCDKHLIK